MRVAAEVPFAQFPVYRAIDLPRGSWNGRHVFALRVRGTALVADGIRDGDYLVVERREPLDSGQTVVAEVDGGLTVKRLFRDPDGRLGLQSSGRDMLPLVVPAERIRIIGAVVAVFRRRGFRASRVGSRRDVGGENAGTLDLTLSAINRRLDDAETIAASWPGPRGDAVRALTRALRSLRDCYLQTDVPRLRAALLREAGEITRRFGEHVPFVRLADAP